MTPLAVSLGDPAGVGPEIVAKAWAQRAEKALPPFFAVGDPRSVAQVWAGPVIEITGPAAAAAAFATGLPILPVWGSGVIQPGRPDLAGAQVAFDSLERAMALVLAGQAGALVTAPVSKAQLYEIGFRYPGQTEFVTDRCGLQADDTVMMLAGPGLRVVPMTTHVPLSAVSALLTPERIVASARVTAHGLRRDFGVATPRLVLAGLNPHAGEGGAIGREEIEVMEPAIALLRAEGIDITGPHAADTLFPPRARERYDAALCGYHDQALVPIKTLFFDDGVNITLGLPVVRTSPDHGTAFGIAGQDRAVPGAMIAAIAMAGAAATRRAAARA